ncbi:MAG: hypothetical protein K6G00_07340, partial [Treponema sp.]|nr:hypothetical protein [Treponema sp.]
KKNKIKDLFVSIFIIVLSFIMAFGLYPVLELPLFSPHAMYGFCVMISFFTLYVTFQKKNWVGVISALSLSWCFFSLFFVYGNVMVEQNRYQNFRINQLICDLNGIDEFSNANKKNLQIKGSMGYSPRVIPVLNQFKSLKRTIYYFTGSDIISELYFRDYFDLRNLDWDYESEIRDFTSLYDIDLPVIKDTMYHTIKGDGINYLIELK